MKRIKFTLGMAMEAVADRTSGPFGLVVMGDELLPECATVVVGDDMAMVGDTIVKHDDGSYSVETDLA